MRDKNSYIQRFIEQDRLGALLNAKFVSLTEDECVYEYEVDKEHYNPGGILHGGALYTVMDSSQGMLMHYVLSDEFKAAATGTANMKYLKALREGKILIRTVFEKRDDRKHYLKSIAYDDVGDEVAVLDEVFIGIRN